MIRVLARVYISILFVKNLLIYIYKRQYKELETLEFEEPGKKQLLQELKEAVLELGLIEHVAPVGKPEHERFTVPV